MGSVAGLALGLALANLRTEVHAVRVADNRFTKREVLDRLMKKTATLLNVYDAAIPARLADETNIVWRDDFYAGGYAIADKATDRAVNFAKEHLGLTLDTTYTGKAMAALLHDLRSNRADTTSLFWNTYNSRPLPISEVSGPLPQGLPEQFQRYFE
jgi:D-cysteine desulfhydrase